MCLALFLQVASCLAQCSAGVAAASEGQNVASTMNSAGAFFFFVVFLPFAIIIGLKINKWTARYWLDRGYKPVGPGWKEWGPKWGLDASSLPNE